MLAVPQLLLGRVRRRRVQVLQGPCQVVGVVPRGQQVPGWQTPQPGQGLAAEIAPLALADAGRGGIDGGEALFHQLISLAYRAVLGVEHFQAAAAAPHLAEAAQAGPACQAALLGCGKVKEAQGEGAAAVLDTRHQTAPLAEYDIGGAHLALDNNIRAFPRGGDGGDPGAILVAQGQVKQQVLHLVHAVLGQPGGQFGAHPAQLPHGYTGDTGHYFRASMSMSMAWCRG